MHISCNNPPPTYPWTHSPSEAHSPYLHEAERLGLLHLAEDQSKHQVQVLPSCCPTLVMTMDTSRPTNEAVCSEVLGSSSLEITCMM